MAFADQCLLYGKICLLVIVFFKIELKRLYKIVNCFVNAFSK